MDIALRLLAVAALILANALFVAAEFALVAVDRGHLHQDSRKSARVAEGLLRELSFHLSGAQLGITITSIALGFIAEPTIGDLLEPLLGDSRSISIILALLAATVIQLVIGELVPKGIAIAKPKETSVRLAKTMLGFSIVFGPLTRVLNNAANRAVRALGIEPVEELASSRTLEELLFVIRSTARSGGLDLEAVKLLDRSIRFSEKQAADALVPRPRVAALNVNDTITDLIEKSDQTGFSRFPVISADLDDIRGIVHVKGALRIDPARRRHTPVTDIMSQAIFVPESRELEDLLVDLRSRRLPMAIVVDEHGGTAGIITVEDLIEEIVGEIVDEYDDEEPMVVPLESGEFLVDARLDVDDLAGTLDVEFPDEEWDTVGGLVLGLAGRVPKIGESFEYHDVTLVAEEVHGRRVARVRVAPR